MGVEPYPCLSVVMPAYNEEATLLTSVSRVLESGWTAEVVIVNDGSKDRTLRRGFAEVTKEFVVVQDADLEYDPAEFGVLLEALIDGRADVVYGSRFLAGGPHRVLYYWHSVGNRFLTTLSNMFTNLNLTDMETCYKVFRREIIQGIDIEEDRFGFEPEVTAKVARGNWRIYEVGISYSGRTYDEGKKIGWKDGVRALVCILRYSKIGTRLRSRG